MTAPPRAGPAMLAICQPLLFHVTALLNRSRGTTCGSNAERAGPLKARATPANSRQRNIHSGGHSQKESAAKPSEANAAVAWAS
jgi:hypothetical protein